MARLFVALGLTALLSLDTIGPGHALESITPRADPTPPGAFAGRVQ